MTQYVVLYPIGSLFNISAIYVNSSISLNIPHMQIICTLGWPFSRSELPRVPTGLLRLKIASLNPHVFQKNSAALRLRPFVLILDHLAKFMLGFRNCPCVVCTTLFHTCALRNCGLTIRQNSNNSPKAFGWHD